MNSHMSYATSVHSDLWGWTYMEIALQTRFILPHTKQADTLRHQVSQRREGLLTRQPSSEIENTSQICLREVRSWRWGAGGIYRILNKAVRQSEVWGKVFGKGAVSVLHKYNMARGLCTISGQRSTARYSRMPSWRVGGSNQSQPAQLQLDTADSAQLN